MSGPSPAVWGEESGKKVKYYSEGGQSAYSWTIASNLKESGLNGLNSGQEKWASSSSVINFFSVSALLMSGNCLSFKLSLSGIWRESGHRPSAPSLQVFAGWADEMNWTPSPPLTACWPKYGLTVQSDNSLHCITHKIIRNLIQTSISSYQNQI